MGRCQVVSARAAAALIPNDAVLTVCGASGLGCPDVVLEAIGERYRTTRSPNNLTSVHPIAAGDMYGIKGIDHLAQVGLLKTVIAGSYPSGPSSLPMPEIWRMIVENRVAAYNIPSGILFDLHREAAAKRPGVITKVGLDTFADPRRQGCAMNEAATKPVVKLIEFEGSEWLYFPAIVPNVAVIRGTTADERGNVSYEHEGAYLGALDQALAVRNNGGIVIAQVKRLTRAGGIKPLHVHVPGILVDYVVVAPDQLQTTNTVYNPAISGEISQPDHEFKLADWGPGKIIARRAAQELRHGDTVNLGFGLSANVPRILLEEGLHGEVTWVIEQGAVGGVPLLDFQFGCSSNADAIVPSPQQFTYFQGGGFNTSMLSFLQIDAEGNVNVSRLAARPQVTAGIGGFADITARARHIVFSGLFNAGAQLAVEDGMLQILKEGKARKLVAEVEHVSFSGRRAREQGQEVVYITERCVMRLERDGIYVTEIAPGIDLERDVLAQSDLPLKVLPDLTAMDPALFRPQPCGLQLRRPTP